MHNGRKIAWLVVLGAVMPVASAFARQNADDATIGPADTGVVHGATQEARPAGPEDSAAAKGRALAAALGSADWSTRDRAEYELLHTRGPYLPALEAALRDPAATPEQRMRLERVARQRFTIEPRAAMGVQFDRSSPAGVVISGPIEGFDAARVLRPVDTIVAIDGYRVTDQDEFRYQIVSREPNQEVELDVIRDGQVIRVTLRLGSYATLPEKRGLDERTLMGAWEARLERLGVSTAETEDQVISTGLSDGAWRVAGQARPARPLPPGVDAAWVDVAPGGEARGHPDVGPMTDASRVDLTIRGNGDLTQIIASFERRLSDLILQVQACESRMAQAQLLAAKPDLPPEERARIAQDIINTAGIRASIQAEIMSVQAQLRALRGGR